MNSKNVRLKVKETSATNSDFFNLFRPIAPAIDKIGKVAQVISALTEGVTIWYITQSEMAGYSKAISIAVSILAMILVIAILELGGRKFLQVLTRAIVWKRLKNAWYIALFAIVMAITVGIGILSFRLSTNGIRHAFVSNVPVVAQFDDSRLKKEYRQSVKDISSRFEKDFQLVKENYQNQVSTTSKQFDAKIDAANVKVKHYQYKYKKGAKWAKGQADKYQKKASAYETEKTTVLSTVQSDYSKKLDVWQAKKDKAITAEKRQLKEAILKGQTDLAKIHDSKHTNANFWGGLFSFFVGFSVILAFICIVSVEVFRRGSGIQIEYEEEEKAPGILSLFWNGLTNRWDNFFRRKAERFANVSSGSAPSSIGFNHSRHYVTNQKEDYTNIR